jgi:hypothetical protein
MKAGLTLSVKDDSDDKAVDTQDTRHDDGHDVLHDLRGVHDAHAGNADAGLGSAICRAEVCGEGWMRAKRWRRCARPHLLE